MVSSHRATDSSSTSRSKRSSDGEIPGLPSKLNHVKKQIQAARLASIKESIEKNMRELQAHTHKRFDDMVVAASGHSDISNVLSVRKGNALCKLAVWEPGEREVVNAQEEVPPGSGTVIFASNGGKTAVRLVRLPLVEKIPPYTTWMFLDKNQRMAEDQSVLGRRQIYYDDKYGSEALICSDSEEEIAEVEEKREFSNGEDEILWKAIQEYGPHQQVLNVLSQLIYASPSEIQERYGVLKEKQEEENQKDPEGSGTLGLKGKSFLDKTLSASLDSFDNLFCRRCLIFDCRLHGCSQNLIIPSEKQSSVFEPEEISTPCGDQCYLWKGANVQAEGRKVQDGNIMCPIRSRSPKTKQSDRTSSEPESSNPDEGIKQLVSNETFADVGRERHASLETDETSINSSSDKAANTSADPMKDVAMHKGFNDEDMSLSAEVSAAATVFACSHKRQKKLPPGDESMDIQKPASITDDKLSDVGEVSPDKFHSIGIEGKYDSGWNTMEKDLYLKGLEIFGRNSCLIARNLLSGLKTCMEVTTYMFNNGASLPIMRTNSCVEDSGKDHDDKEQDIPSRSRMLRRRGRARKLKYTWKSAGHPSIRKRIGDGEHSCRQYAPCGCSQMCGKQCPCMNNGTCCEKYCGCSKSCKHRFRGCHCAKSQCRSRQCPCFAAGRECDPDVCRNCWVSCGDGTLGEPPVRGDGYQCGNMNLLLKQRQRILLGRSDVAGWGAFIKNPVNKNDYLGEYTGELISHKEADKRGKIYDRANSSFLFDLNDQFVLDAYRKGDKLKFANHSSNPNCYAKVMLVAGDHRVGIFAKEHIEASEELFYDYRYGPDQAPAWARKPEGSRKDDSSASHTRAQKVA